MADLCALSDIVAALGIVAPVAGTPDGDKILAQYASLISAASGAFLNATNRKTIAAAPFTETRNGNGAASMVLRAYPIIAISSLSINGLSWPPYSSASGYVLNDDGYSVDLVGGLYFSGARNVSIAYTAGYQTVPAEIRQAVVEWVLWKKAKMPRIDQVSISLNGAETTSFDRGGAPPYTRDVIQQYTDLGGFRG